MPLGKTLKALRQKQGFNQKALSSLSGVSQATISRVETGRVRQLRSVALKNLADALGVSADFLMGDHEVFAPIPTTSLRDAVPGLRQDRFRQIADHLEAFVLHDKGRILYANWSLAGLLNYAKEDLLGKNLIDLFTAPVSRPLARRMNEADTDEPYEVILVRRNGSCFPAELASRKITESMRLITVLPIGARRAQQALVRVHRRGIQTESLAEMGAVLQIVADELKDTGVDFVAVGLNIIDEEADSISFYTVYAAARGAGTLHRSLSLQQALEEYPVLRALQSHWRRDKVWEREPDEEFAQLLRQCAGQDMGYRPRLLIDVPFPQGTLSVGLGEDPPARTRDIAEFLRQVSHPIAAAIKRLRQVEILTHRLASLGEDSQGEPQNGSAELLSDPEVLSLCRDYRDLSAAHRELVRAFVRRLDDQESSTLKGTQS